MILQLFKADMSFFGTILWFCPKRYREVKDYTFTWRPNTWPCMSNNKSSYLTSHTTGSQLLTLVNPSPCFCSLAFHPCCSGISHAVAASRNEQWSSLWGRFLCSSLHVTLWNSAVWSPCQRAWSISATREHYHSLMAAKRPTSGRRGPHHRPNGTWMCTIAAAEWATEG